MDPVLLLSALLLLAFGLIGVGTAEPGLLQDHLLRVGAALLALVLGHLLPPRLLLRYALHALVGLLPRPARAAAARAARSRCR